MITGSANISYHMLTGLLFLFCSLMIAADIYGLRLSGKEKNKRVQSGICFAGLGAAVFSWILMAGYILTLQTSAILNVFSDHKALIVIAIAAGILHLYHEARGASL